MISVPAMVAVPTTRSPRLGAELADPVPVKGHRRLVLEKIGLGASESNWARAMLTCSLAPSKGGSTWRRRGGVFLAVRKSESEMSLALNRGRQLAGVFEAGLFEVGAGGCRPGWRGRSCNWRRRNSLAARWLSGLDLEEEGRLFLTDCPSLMRAGLMISPETSGLILTWRAGSIFAVSDDRFR